MNSDAGKRHKRRTRLLGCGQSRSSRWHGASLAGGAGGSTSLQRRPCLNPSAFGHDDNARADVVAFAVVVPMALLVHQLRAVADARVLVDDDTVEDDVAADAEPGVIAARWRVMVCLVEVGAEQHGATDSRAGLDVCADADD